MHTRPARHIVTSEGELFLMTASDPRFNHSHKAVTLAHETSRKTVVNDCTAQLYLGDNGKVYAVGYDWSACEMVKLWQRIEKTPASGRDYRGLHPRLKHTSQLWAATLKKTRDYEKVTCKRSPRQSSL